MGLLDDNFRGLQHIGIPVTNLEKSIEFYKKLGFTPEMSAPFDNENGTGKCCMAKRKDTVIELYQLLNIELHVTKKR